MILNDFLMNQTNLNCKIVCCMKLIHCSIQSKLPLHLKVEDCYIVLSWV